MARIHLVHTGGTLGMAPSGGALEPGPYLARVLEDVPELARLADVDVEIAMNVDSSEMTPAHWDRLATLLAARLDAYDGFVVIHGTDTMAYTACALSFALHGLTKPVVLTGSQRPLRATPTDARGNLASAVDFARRDIPEVTICMGAHLLRGNRARKVSSQRFDAFASPDYPPLGSVGLEVEIDAARVRRPTGPLRLATGFDPSVSYLQLWPGASASAMDRAVAGGARVVVLGAFGTGNLPTGPGGWVSAIRRATDLGVLVVILTQCDHGVVRPHLYRGGKAALDAGAIPGDDMTVEAALVKGMFLAAQGFRGESLRAAYAQDLAGEVTR